MIITHRWTVTIFICPSRNVKTFLAILISHYKIALHGSHMEKVTISVRIPKEVKEELSRYKIEISRIVRKALEEEVRRKKLEELKKAARKLGDLFAKIPNEEIVKNIKEKRKSR